MTRATQKGLDLRHMNRSGGAKMGGTSLVMLRIDLPELLDSDLGLTH